MLAARLRLLLHRRRVVWWSGVLLLAGLTAATVARLTSSAEAALDAYGETRVVLVARTDLEPGAPVGPAHTELVRRPVALVPPDALTELPDGSVASQAIAAGEVVLARRVAPVGSSPLAAALRPATRAVAVPAGPAIPPLEPGDSVDVIVTPTGSLDATPVRVARSSRVVAVQEEAVVVAVPQDLVATVVGALATGVVGLALVPAAEAG